MIRSFRHKGLKGLFEDDDARGLNPEHIRKLQLILVMLNAAAAIEHMNVPAFRLHWLKGSLDGFWAVTVRANWRVIFRFAGAHAYEVEYVDYH